MNTLGFTIVGFGTIAKTHMVALRTLPIIKKLPLTPVLDTLVTRRTDELSDQAKQIGFSFVTADLEEALLRDHTQAVSICTPNALHAEQVRAAVKHNKAIYCEKPVTESGERTKALLQDVPSTYPAQLAFVFRYHPAVMHIREWLKEGLIGEVLQCKVTYLRSGYLNAARPVSWRLSDSMSGGGAITDIGVHALDLVRHLFGDIASIDGKTHTFVPERPSAAGASDHVSIKVDDWATMTFETAKGVLGQVEVSRIAFGSDAFRIEVVGSKGSMTADLEKDKLPQLHLLAGGIPVLPVPKEIELLPDEKATLGVFQDSHTAALHHFVLRQAGDTRWNDLTPTLQDGCAVELLVDQIIARSNS
ncbi:Gfo/Idh/MocA family protein [Paenibacillus sp. 1001270B_150601_E10]|uniref:Gfo/Idh/MocA family protein n=1 Tax=Paenibacillus sp. 1001270B_150601_E10 TaxID=2787079 RepID=UPI00189D195F|nr:Gfo/Idh/MocA family oxidoreductase [Paenibacillus sp. 1001270B_150601_E10]